MEKRLRSPNYPAIGLPEAIEKVAALYRAQNRHAAPREIVARGMGYNSLNGASASTISALQKYGLLAKAGEGGLKVSDRAMRILHPHSAAERAAAICEAAYDPPLFTELREHFDGLIPSEDLLRSYLIRKGFAPAALTAVIAAYRETSEIAETEERAHDSLRDQPQEHAPMAATAAPLARGQASAHTAYTPAPDEPFRVSFVPGGIEVSGRITCPEKADELVAAIQALKFLLRSPGTEKQLADDDGSHESARTGLMEALHQTVEVAKNEP